MNSPCVKVCRVGFNNICTGCYRTVDEITRWPYLSNTDKQQILEQLDRRKDDNLGHISKQP